MFETVGELHLSMLVDRGRLIEILLSSNLKILLRILLTYFYIIFNLKLLVLEVAHYNKW